MEDSLRKFQIMDYYLKSIYSTYNPAINQFYKVEHIKKAYPIPEDISMNDISELLNIMSERGHLERLPIVGLDDHVTYLPCEDGSKFLNQIKSMLRNTKNQKISFGGIHTLKDLIIQAGD